ncbi:MAG: Hsp20/alpha crystallin family protein [Gemmatimonadota bacterium]|nr:Hsp20/alpha crystallin family protein [Gemmatimonadota bacterium]
MVTARNRLVTWPFVSSDFWRDMNVNDAQTESELAATWTPRARVTESSDQYTLRLEVPGADPSGLDVELNGEFLVASGHIPGPDSESGEKLLLSESFWGRFERRFRLKSAVDRDAITADYVDGILTIKVPKRQEARPRRIPVSTSAD